jgi:hypothetical protein
MNDFGCRKCTFIISDLHLQEMHLFRKDKTVGKLCFVTVWIDGIFY